MVDTVRFKETIRPSEIDKKYVSVGKAEQYLHYFLKILFEYQVNRTGGEFCAEDPLPATVYGMEKYLGSGLIKGVGPKFAKKIVQKYGVDTFAVIEDNVELLIEIEGIGRKRVS